MDLKGIFESVKSVKLTGGIFGKTTLLLIVLCVCVTVVIIRFSIWWLGLLLILLLMGIVFYALKRCLDFAEKNPYAAIMEGAELLHHERIVHGIKGHAVLPIQEATTDHEPPQISEEEAASEDTSEKKAEGNS